MTESSRFWNTSGVGDGQSGGFDRAAVRGFWTPIFLRNALASGVLHGVGSELAVNGSSSPLSLAAGAALVDGVFYENTAALNLTVTTPSSGTTGGRVVLRANWSAQTVRAVVKLNTDGNSSPPTLTQTSGTTYELGLYTFTITTGGVIGSLTRDLALPGGYAKIGSAISPEMMILAGAGVLGNPGSAAAAAQRIATSGDGVFRRAGTSFGVGEIAEAMIAAGAVGAGQIAAESVDDSKLGDRVPQFYRRQGGSAADWKTPGNSGYTPGKVRMMCGSYHVGWGISGFYQEFNLTFPAGLFSAAPFVLATLTQYSGFSLADRVYFVRITVNSATSASVMVSQYNVTGSTTIAFNWLAIGPG